MTPSLRSPVTGSALVDDGSDLLGDSDGRLWPIVDGIPFLRVGRDALIDEVVARLRRQDREGALASLLADQDDWWTGDPPAPTALRRLVRERHALSLRAAMDLLGFDRVGHYFAHRWSDPTFLAGLALLEAHWRPAHTAFELACGIGHYGRELVRAGLRYTGVDVVFSKLWLARHWVLPPDATLLCFDAATAWPVAGSFDLVFCHDAFYFLEPKPAILAALRALAGPQGRIAVSHIHNSGAANLSAGRAMAAADIARLFPAAMVYDDAELTQALAEARVPRSAPLDTLAQVEAFSLEDRVVAPARAVTGGVAVPPPAAALRLNPLYRAHGSTLTVAWPSPRYEAEYAGRATYPRHLPAGSDGRPAGLSDDREAARRRILVDLPERW